MLVIYLEGITGHTQYCVYQAKLAICRKCCITVANQMPCLCCNNDFASAFLLAPTQITCKLTVNIHMSINHNICRRRCRNGLQITIRPFPAEMEKGPENAIPPPTHSPRSPPSGTGSCNPDCFAPANLENAGTYGRFSSTQCSLPAERHAILV